MLERARAFHLRKRRQTRWNIWHGRAASSPGCKAEYQRRHNEIWPEMVAVLKEAGICNYSIFYVNDELFGYYECEKGVAWAEKVQAESPVVARWNEYMADILELEMDPRHRGPAQAGTGVPVRLIPGAGIRQGSSRTARGSGGKSSCCFRSRCFPAPFPPAGGCG